MTSPSEPTERTHLLSIRSLGDDTRIVTPSPRNVEARSLATSILSKEEELLGSTAVGEILPYNDYSSIDFLHDLVKDVFRHRLIHSRPGVRGYLYATWDALSGWIVVALVGIFTGILAFFVDITEATISDYKFGYCSTNILYSREECCRVGGKELIGDACTTFKQWGSSYSSKFGPYLVVALVVGVLSSSITMLSRTSLPSASRDLPENTEDDQSKALEDSPPSKTMYMTAGAGVPEIKTILSGFVIPKFLGPKVLVLKTLGAILAVASGLPLGKEAPLIHIGACIANLVAQLFPKYAHNGKQLREVIVAGSAAGISAAFGAPIGGVLFAYEELSVYFPRKALYRTFLCSMAAAITLKLCNPFGTGKLVLFETKYETSYNPIHYLVFILIGLAGGVWGGTFTQANRLWARWFRQIPPIKHHPVLEVALVTAVVAALQFVNPGTRARYDVIIRTLLVDCSSSSSSSNNAATDSWVCANEGDGHAQGSPLAYRLWLLYGSLVVLATTTITAGIKLPSGIIMPALSGGALFGRLVAQFFSNGASSSTSSSMGGVFAMVGASAFLAGVTRMTISLCVVMFELTGELEAVVPHMVAILCAKWVADAISRDSIYDLTQSALGHPFLSPDEAMWEVAQAESEERAADRLIPPLRTMRELTVVVPADNKVARKLLQGKLDMLKRRGLMDSGLVLVQGNDVIQGYIPQHELEFGLNELGASFPREADVRLLGSAISDDELDLSRFVNRAPVCICASAPVEVVVALFTHLGVRYICLTEEGTGALVGVVIRKRLMGYLDGLKNHH